MRPESVQQIMDETAALEADIRASNERYEQAMADADEHYWDGRLRNAIAKLNRAQQLQLLRARVRQLLQL